MRKKKQKSNQVLRTIITMKLARSLKCSLEEAARKIKAMDKAI